MAFPDNQMQILPYNRVVRDLNGRTPAAFLAALRRAVRRDAPDGPAAPARKGQVAMYLDGALVRRSISARRPRRRGPTPALDVSRLQDGVLAPLLGIADVRTDKRIDFVGGIRGTGELERLVDGGAVRRGVLAVSRSRSTT